MRFLKAVPAAVPPFKLIVAVIALAILSVTLGSQGGANVHADLQAYFAGRVAALGAPATFSFAVYSDIHMIENASYGLTRAQWQRLLSRWRDNGNLFGVIVGDLGYGNETDID